jgi:hypothetical protein
MLNPQTVPTGPYQAWRSVAGIRQTGPYSEDFKEPGRLPHNPDSCPTIRRLSQIVGQVPEVGALPEKYEFTGTFRAGGVLFGQNGLLPENS